MTKAAYNADSNPSDWAANWAGAIKLSLGIFDALDDQCGNQLGYGLLTLPNYGLLSQVLAGDALQVDTSKTTCSIYLGLELNATGAMANTDCGGRTLTENTIDTTYAGLVGLPPVTGKGVTNGITAPAVAPSPTFPFFAPPQ